MCTEQRRDLLDRGEDGEHGPRASRRATGHERPASMGQHRQRIVVDPPGRAEGGQFAEAVPAEQVGADSEILQDPQQSQADRPDRRLGEAGLLQGGFARLPPRVVERRGGIDPIRDAAGLIEGGLVHPRERLLHPGEEARQLAEHAHVLRSLTGKQHGQRARARPGSQEEPGIGEDLPSGGRGAARAGIPSRRQPRSGLVEQLVPAAFASPGDQEQPMPMLRAESSPAPLGQLANGRPLPAALPTPGATRGSRRDHRPRTRGSAHRRPNRRPTFAARLPRGCSGSCCLRTRTH